jgi:hypothetical protein
MGYAPLHPSVNASVTPRIDFLPMSLADQKLVHPSATRSWRQVAFALLLFGLAFGYLEAAVVVYLRDLSEPVRVSYYPGTTPEDLFPLPTPGELRTANRGELWRLFPVEMAREAATLIMLAAIAFIAGTNSMQRLAAFVVAFGIWDIAFYVSLKILIGWPASLLTWDLLFLFPVPWSGPVLAPVIVACSMIGCGLLVLWHEEKRRAVRLGWVHWAGIFLGALIILISFTWDYRTLLSGQMPHPYRWLLFAGGEVLGVGSFLFGLPRERVS